MKAAKQKDRKTMPLPERTAILQLDRTFTQDQMALIRGGFVPKQMEDKWFIYWKDDALYFHRSWTGFCIYVVQFREEGGNWRMIAADVNRDPEQYSERRDARDAAMVAYLIDLLLLSQEAEFPADEAVASELRPLSQWSSVGRAMFGKGSNQS